MTTTTSTTTTTKYLIQSLAYLKIILHSAKYPSSNITGILLGYFEEEEEAAEGEEGIESSSSRSSSKRSNSIIISDVIPLLHHWNDLSPMMELALQLIEIYSKSKNMIMLGLYVGNNRIEAIEISIPAKKVADLLQKEFNKAIVLVVDNENLATDSSPALIPYLSSNSSNWSKSNLPLNLTDPTIISRALDQVREGKHKDLSDFDEYLENVSIDWLSNKGIKV